MQNQNAKLCMYDPYDVFNMLLKIEMYYKITFFVGKKKEKIKHLM